jgi:AcrR family transcriptional regulator
VRGAGGRHWAGARHGAAEAGLAVGCARHYFDSHAELLSAAAREMVHRVEARVPARLEEQSHGGDPRRFVEAIASEFLPLDPARADGTAAWPEFSVAARTHPTLAAIATELHDGPRDISGGCCEIVRGVWTAGTCSLTV